MAADENILNSSRATDFLTPKSTMSKIFRNAVLTLAEDHAFARPLINSGRLSVPSVYDGSPLNFEDALDGGPERSRPGAVCPDAPYGNDYLLDHLAGGFTVLGLNVQANAVDGAQVLNISARDDLIAERYLGDAPQAVYLIRPDQHVVGRWAQFDERAIKTAIRKATGH